MRHTRFVLVLSLLSFAPGALAQTGFPPFASIEQSRFDARNDQNMNVNFALPIVASPGRGMTLNLSAVYNSLTWVPKNIANTLYWTIAPQGDFGWQLNSPIGNTSYSYSSSRTRCGFVDGMAAYTYIYTYNNYTYVDPYGTQHPFSIWQTETVNNCTNSDTFQGTYTGYANDLSGLFASIVVDPTNPVVTTKSGIAITNTKQTDTNGNYISSSSQSGETDWTDSAGRLALKIVSGTSSIQYKFYDPTGAYQTTTLNLQSFSVKTNFGCSGVVEYNNTAVLPVSLVLPNSQTYTFTYEQTPANPGYTTGRLQRITLPTTGYYEYDYTGANDGINCADGTTLSMNRLVNDGTSTATWNFVRNTSNLTTTITTPQLADTPNANDTKIVFNSSGQETSRVIYKESPGVTAWRTINTTWAANGTPVTKTVILEDGSTQSQLATSYDSNGLLDSMSEWSAPLNSQGGVYDSSE